MTPPSKNISAWKIRKLFNDGGYYERTRRGDFKIKRKERLASPEICSVFGAGTLSIETIAFDKDTDHKIFVTHHYESATGAILERNKITNEIMSTGKMDPKRLFHEGILYHYDATIIDDEVKPTDG